MTKWIGELLWGLCQLSHLSFFSFFSLGDLALILIFFLSCNLTLPPLIFHYWINIQTYQLSLVLNNNDNNKSYIHCSSYRSFLFRFATKLFKRVDESYISILYSPTHSNFSPLLYQTSISQGHQWPFHIQIHLKKVDSQFTSTQSSIWHGWPLALLETVPSPCSWYTDIYTPILSIIMHLWNDCNVPGTVLSSSCALSNLFLVTTLKSLTLPFAFS